jgi:hypothetical protein
MKMFLLVMVSILITALLGADGTAAAAGQTFSNTDLEKYTADADGSIIPEKTPSTPQAPKKELRSSKGSNEKSKEYWCSRGSARHAKVDKVKARVEEAEQKLSESRPLNKKNRASAEKKVRSAKKELYRAEQSLEELEQQAHRQNIPPGWLRCQFSY